MADTVSTQVLTDTTGVKFGVKMTNFSDGTGETLVKKVDASELTFMTEDGERKISKIFWSVNTQSGKSAVELIWDGETNATAVTLSGQGFWDLRADGNEIVRRLVGSEMCIRDRPNVVLPSLTVIVFVPAVATILTKCALPTVSYTHLTLPTT